MSTGKYGLNTTSKHIAAVDVDTSNRYAVYMNIKGAVITAKRSK